MIITFIQYTNPFYRDRLVGVDYYGIHIRAREIKPNEMEALEKIARQGTYLMRSLGRRKRSLDGKIAKFQGFRNEVGFEINSEETNIHIQGPYAPSIGEKIEDLPFVRFERPKREMARYIG